MTFGVMYEYTVEKGIVQERGGREGGRERESVREVGYLGRLMTPGLSKDNWCHV